MELIPQELTPDAFDPYGNVVTVPEAPGREYFEAALGNNRPHARPSLSMVHKLPIEGLPLEAKLFERHEFSSQTFVPIDVASWLIVVCPHAAAGGPDSARAVAFLARGNQGVTYKPNVWHHPLTVFERPASFAVFMWRDGTSSDEEFVSVPPFTIGR